MRLLLDQGVPRDVVALLRAAGVDAEHTADIGLARALDAEILDHAARAGLVVVTLDADFHTLLALGDASTPSVVRLRGERLRADAVATLVLRALEVCADALATGAAVTGDSRRVRVRRLPLVR